MAYQITLFVIVSPDINTKEGASFTSYDADVLEKSSWSISRNEMLGYDSLTFFRKGCRSLMNVKNFISQQY